jgi:hypothetical protein
MSVPPAVAGGCSWPIGRLFTTSNQTFYLLLPQWVLTNPAGLVPPDRSRLRCLDLSRGSFAGPADYDGLVEVENELSVCREVRFGEAVCLPDSNAEVRAEACGADVAGRLTVKCADGKRLGHPYAGRLDSDLLGPTVEEEPDGFRLAQALEEVGIQMYAAAGCDGRVHPQAGRFDRTAGKFFEFEIDDCHR